MSDASGDSTVPYSLLDLAPITAGSTARESFARSLDLAQHAERWGYRRYWLAEHHNIAGIASAATAVVIGHVAGGTSSIRVGSGGIMLPNHAPLTIAEQFGTLESLYPGRIDLGVGRAPGGDQATARALRRYLGGADTFPADLEELQHYYAAASPQQAVRAVPGEGLGVPIYLLGSSDFSARLAAARGLPFAFASHFAPDYLPVAIELYRSEFVASRTLSRPHLMVAVNVFAADSDGEAQRLFTSLQQAFVQIVRRTRGPLPPPVDSMEGRWSAPEQAYVEHNLHYSAVGSPALVKKILEQVLLDTGADELILTGQIYDPAARLKSFEIAAQVMKEIKLDRAKAAVG